jgi:hypothetical protein
MADELASTLGKDLRRRREICKAVEHQLADTIRSPEPNRLDRILDNRGEMSYHDLANLVEQQHGCELQDTDPALFRQVRSCGP